MPRWASDPATVLIELSSARPCPAHGALEHDSHVSAPGGRIGDVSQPLTEPEYLPPATEQQVRAHAAELVGVAARHGITDLAFASPGRLRGHVGEDRNLFDMFEFQREATALIDAEVVLYSDGALRNEHVSPDLAAATPL